MSDASDNKDERIQSLEERVIQLSRMLVKSFSYADQDPDTFLQNARRTTEAICRFLYLKEIGEPKGKMMLNDYGRDLMAKKVIPDRIGILIGTIQTYGNYASHAQEDLSEATREWIAPCQTALAGLTNWFFLEYLKGNIPEELVTAVKGISDTAASNQATFPAVRSNSSRRIFMAIAGIAVIGVACFVVYRSFFEPVQATVPSHDPGVIDDNKDGPPRVAKDPNAKRMAIIYFDSPDDPNLSRLRKGLADMIISDLSKLNSLNVIERSRLEEILKEQKLNNSKEFDPSTATRLGKLLGVQYILTGSYFEIFGNIRIDARIIEVETGKIVNSEGIDGETSAFFALEKELVQKIITGLKVQEPVPTQSTPASMISYDGTMLYSDGLEQMDNGNLVKAEQIFNELLAKYPDFEPARKALETIKASPS